MKYPKIETIRRLYRINYYESIPLKKKLTLYCMPFLQQDQMFPHLEHFGNINIHVDITHDNSNDLNAWLKIYSDGLSDNPKQSLVGIYTTTLRFRNYEQIFNKCVLFNNLVENHCIELYDTMHAPITRVVPDLKTTISKQKYEIITEATHILETLIQKDTEQYNISVGNLLYDQPLTVLSTHYKQ